MGVAQKRSSPTANPGGKKRRKSVDYTARMAEEEALMMSMQSMVATLSRCVTGTFFRTAGREAWRRAEYLMRPLGPLIEPPRAVERVASETSRR